MTLPSPSADPAAQRRADRTTATYRAALEACGASVVELRPQEPPISLDLLDGLLLTGGGDIDPKHFGEKPHPKLGPPDGLRDRFELWLAREALARELPVLGICRGAQVLGVVLGGQLVQDIDSEVEQAERHRAPEGEKLPCHAVEIAAGSLLSLVVKASRVRVNSSHHQANQRLGPGVRRTAWAADGVTEAIERDGNGFVLGVQWHPERMWRRAPRQSRLFRAFVEAASGGRHHSSRE
jgi:putative glutamine amidotransferase